MPTILINFSTNQDTIKTTNIIFNEINITLCKMGPNEQARMEA